MIMREVPNNILHYYWISNLFGTETPHSMSHQSTFFPSINDQKREKNTKGDDILQFINIQQNVKKKKKGKRFTSCWLPACPHHAPNAKPRLIVPDRG